MHAMRAPGRSFPKADTPLCLRAPTVSAGARLFLVEPPCSKQVSAARQCLSKSKSQKRTSSTCIPDLTAFAGLKWRLSPIGRRVSPWPKCTISVREKSRTDVIGRLHKTSGGNLRSGRKSNSLKRHRTNTVYFKKFSGDLTCLSNTG